MKKTIYFLMLALFSGISAGMYAEENPFSEGDGLSAETAYGIETVEQLKLLGTETYRKNFYYKLLNDIDLSGEINWVPIGSSSAAFESKFNGNGFKITNLNINRPDENNVGLFGYTAGDIGSTVFENLTLEGGSVIGKDLVGALVGRCNATINNCHSNVNVTGVSSVGGLFGWLHTNTVLISSSSCTGNVTGVSKVGGFAGTQENNSISGTAKIENCSATGVVTATGDMVGGLIGFSTYKQINSSWASGNVTGVKRVGGLVGHASAGADYSQVVLNMQDCYAKGNVQGMDSVGGLIGLSNIANMNGCAATGNVEGRRSVGGLIGNARNNQGVAANVITMTISNCYASGDVSGTAAYVGSFIGDVSRTSGNSPITITRNFAKGNVSSTASNTSGFIGRAQQNTVVNKNTTATEIVTNGTHSLYRLVGHPSVVSTAAPLYTDNYAYENMQFTPQNKTEERPSLDGANATLAMLKDSTVYTAINWDFSSEGVWRMNIGQGKDLYPILKTIYVAPDNTTEVNNSKDNQTCFAYSTSAGINIKSEVEMLAISLFDINGKLVYKQTGNLTSETVIRGDILNSGIYILRVITSKGSNNIKLRF